MYYLQSRYYDPDVCRFINADEYASTGQGFIGCNMFAYCNNNPANYLDADGLNPESATLWASSMWWLHFVDGPFPIGDIVYWVGLVVLASYTAIVATDTFGNKAGDADEYNKQSQYVANFGSTTGTPNDPDDNNSNRNWQKVNDKYLKQKLAEQGTNPHDVKYEYLGSKASIKRYDIHVDKGTGQLGIYDKFTKQIIEVTHYYLGGR